MNTLLYTLARLAQLQAQAVDRVALHEACKAATEPSGTSGTSGTSGSSGLLRSASHLDGEDAGSTDADADTTVHTPDPQTQMATVCRHLQVSPAVWLSRPDASALLHHAERGWGILRGQNGQGQWVSEWVDARAQKWTETVLDVAAIQDCAVARVRLQKPFEASSSPVLRLVKEELLANKKVLIDAALGGIVINLIGLDRLWALQDDHHGCEHPLVPGSVQGRYRLEEVSSAYGGNKALEVKALSIQAGERIGIIGPIGGGKTTLLRLLSGMYKPQGGRILLDDMELSHISKPLLAQRIGYSQQDGRLFAGTLRENLVLGMMDPGDTAILEAAKRIGLLGSVIAVHPKGLQHDTSSTVTVVFTNTATVNKVNTDLLLMQASDMLTEEAARRAATPLILDLNVDGVQTTTLTQGVLFDVAHSGVATQSAWVSPADGLLVGDINHDGVINNGSELFGQGTLLADGNHAANGFAALAQFDANYDGQIDTQDEVF